MMVTETSEKNTRRRPAVGSDRSGLLARSGSASPADVIRMISFSLLSADARSSLASAGCRAALLAAGIAYGPA